MTNIRCIAYRISIVFGLAFILLGCKQGREQAEVTDRLKNEGDGYPEIGKPCPPFTLESITYYHKEQASLEDFKGKPLILDFWTRSCRSCIASFPKVNWLQEQFGDQVRFMLVSREDGKNKGVREVYERFRKRYKLNLPVSYTAELFDKFGVTTVPHVVWIDGEGVVKAITSGAQVKAENIQDFIAGKELKLFKKPNREEEENMARQEESAAENEDTETTGVLYRSELTGVNRAIYNTAFPSSFVPSLVEKHSGFRMDNVSVEGLYRLAYTDTVRSVPYDRKNTSYGKFWARPVLEVTDSSAFEFDREAEKGVYCYRLKVPENKSRDPLYVQQIMRRDLKNYFGYDVQVETRPMPC
ncbi:TlpA family protein disulfide reductase [Sinomicrobium sp. M5D2P9]